MSFFSETDSVPEYYIISVMNSFITANYVDSFINSTSHCTTGDAKLIPIIVPTKEQISEIKNLFDRAISLRINGMNHELENLQDEVDNYFEILYRI